jgi:hypothetical protein
MVLAPPRKPRRLRSKKPTPRRWRITLLAVVSRTSWSPEFTPSASRMVPASVSPLVIACRSTTSRAEFAAATMISVPSGTAASETESMKSDEAAW